MDFHLVNIVQHLNLQMLVLLVERSEMDSWNNVEIL